MVDGSQLHRMCWPASVMSCRQRWQPSRATVQQQPCVPHSCRRLCQFLAKTTLQRRWAFATSACFAYFLCGSFACKAYTNVMYFSSLHPTGAPERIGAAARHRRQQVLSSGKGNKSTAWRSTGMDKRIYLNHCMTSMDERDHIEECACSLIVVARTFQTLRCVPQLATL